jgi:biotin carboxylase
VRIIVLAGKPTDSVTYGFLPAAERLGLRVTLLTDRPARHAAEYAGRPGAPAEIHRCEVFDVRAVLDRVGRHPTPDAVFTNSDHLQTQAALAADYLGLPGKDWRATARAKNKALMRRHLAERGIDTVGAWPIDPDAGELPDVPYPCVLKPAEGVASEDVYLVGDPGELADRVAGIRRRRPGQVLLAEEFLAGPVRTLETLGDAHGIRVLGGFATELSAPPYFVERRMRWLPEPPRAVSDAVLAQLAALGVGLGACHTEFVLQGERVRLIEVNYRIAGDQCDLLMADLLGEPLFEQVLRAHLGEHVSRPANDAGQRTPARHGLIEWALADRTGMLVAAPPPVDADRLVYRPLRAVGERVELTHTNRDYLGVLRVHGPDPDALDAAVAAFWAEHSWEIAP